MDVDVLLNEVPDGDDELTKEQFFGFLKLIHIALRQVRLSYEVNINTGNDAIDALLKGIDCKLEDYELENE